MRFNSRKSTQRLFAFVLFLFLLMPAIAADDDYLKAIEAETSKVGIQADESENKTEGQAPVDEDTATNNEVSEERVAFEAVLKDRYHGSYTFYSKLPERSRQEIVQEYKRGTPFVKITKKIVDRSMQR